VTDRHRGITLETVSAPTKDVCDLIGELDHTLAQAYSPEQQHGLSLDAIFQPHMRFFVAQLDGVAVGCGGVALFATFAEVKRMYVRESARGQGVAQALLLHIERVATERGLDVLRLETGDRQLAAIRLYERAGFRVCEAFGDYAEMAPQAIATSIFYEKRLRLPAGSRRCQVAFLELPKTPTMVEPDKLDFGPDGLLPVVIQDARTGAVLTLAYANRNAVERTLAERTTYLYSRSRQALWRKGETSGNTQEVIDVRHDCDGDALLYEVIPSGPACHTGAISCFEGAAHAVSPFAEALSYLRTTIASRRSASPEESYTAKLLSGGIDRIAKKIGEEATEVVIAAKNGSSSELIWETADLLFHLLVLLEERGVSLDEVGEELLRRAKK
jgi:phosphoribosyl-ATP pyrophosphohydrolase/phosphoribosyl-AMP cyclohydrolase